MQKYTRLYGWIWKIFGREKFSLSRFTDTFWVPNPRKAIHDLVEGGYLERVERGKYKAVKPELWMKNIVESTPRAVHPTDGYVSGLRRLRGQVLGVGRTG